MKWLKRTLWLFAWSVWLWLGLGLHRELPRSFGSPIFSIETEKIAHIFGFVAETNNIAVVEKTASDTTTIKVYDGHSGTLVLESPGPHSGAYRVGTLDGRQHGVLFASLYSDDEWAKEKPGLYLFDLTRGNWRRVSDRSAIDGAIHCERPWIAFEERIGERRRAGDFVVLDVETGNVVFHRSNVKERSLAGDPFFLPARSTLVVPTVTYSPDSESGSARSEQNPNGRVLEVWRYDDDWVLEKTIAFKDGLGSYSASSGGRLAIPSHPDAATFSVFDLNDGRVIFTDVGSRPLPPSIYNAARDSQREHPPVISADGRRVIGGWWATIWDVDSKTVVWSRNRWSSPLPREGAREFLVWENWSILWNEWFPGFTLETFAYRDLATGEFLRRTTDEVNVTPTNWNAARTLCLSDDGKVYRLPNVNWPLLAVCQAILALPLAWFWWILHWRRKRKMRLA